MSFDNNNGFGVPQLRAVAKLISAISAKWKEHTLKIEYDLFIHYINRIAAKWWVVVSNCKASAAMSDQFWQQNAIAHKYSQF